MAGHHAFPASPPPSSLRHLSVSLTGQIQTQAMSHAKFIFLVALVVFFIVLFVVAYIWMRRPDFGQKGGHPIRAASRTGFAPPARREASDTRSDGEAVAADAAWTPRDL
jgi:hypothetical protein